MSRAAEHTGRAPEDLCMIGQSIGAKAGLVLLEDRAHHADLVGIRHRRVPYLIRADAGQS